MNRFAISFALLALAPAVSFAQATSAPSTSPVADALRDGLARYSKRMVAAADAMPADKFSFKPTPDQITFAHLTLHISESNHNFCSKIAGIAAPEAHSALGTGDFDGAPVAAGPSLSLAAPSASALASSPRNARLATSIGAAAGSVGSLAAAALVMTSGEPVAWALRGMQEFLIDLASQPEFPKYNMERLSEVYIENTLRVAGR